MENHPNESDTVEWCERSTHNAVFAGSSRRKAIRKYLSGNLDPRSWSTVHYDCRWWTNHWAGHLHIKPDLWILIAQSFPAFF